MTTQSFPSLNELTGHIQSIVQGGDAKSALEYLESLPSSTLRRSTFTVITLPVWADVVPAIDTGRRIKGKYKTLPGRIGWSSPTVFVMESEAVDAHWRITSLGLDEEGAVKITPDSSLHNRDNFFEITPQIDTYMGQAVVLSLKKRISEGRNASWNLAAALEPYARLKMAEANRVLAKEVTEYTGIPVSGVLDPIGLEPVLDGLLFGNEGSPDSVLTRMINRSLIPSAFDHCDPGLFFTANIKSTAVTALRRHIGDPHIGPKVRRLQQRHQFTNIDDLITEYNRCHPKDRLSVSRAVKALSVGPSPESLAALTAETLLIPEQVSHD